MMYLISTFHYWLLLALAFGVLVGWITCGRGGGGLMPWLIAIALGALAAVAQLLPERAGLWLELATLMLTAYVAGGCIGCLLGRMFGKRLGEPAKSGALAAATSRPITRVMIREKERAVEPQLKPLSAAAAAPEEAVVGLSAPRGGVADDLTKVYGIDSETQGKLNALGIYHYDQLATLTPGNRRWVFRNLGHEGRFPSWWWRWRYDAEKLMNGQTPEEAPVMPSGDDAEEAAAAPVALASPAQEEGERPPTLEAPQGGKGDDLKRIRGIGKQNEGRLHGLGVWHFSQIAAWTPEQVQWVGHYLAFPGRIEREDWVAQAKVLAQGGETEFSKRADAGKVATSRDTGNDDGQSNIATPGKDFQARENAEKGPGDKA